MTVWYATEAESKREGGYATKKDMARQAVITGEAGERELDRFERKQHKIAAKERKRK